MSVIVLEEIVVKDDRLRATVFCSETAALVSACVGQKVCDLLPGLADHVCVSAGNERFGDEICGTQTPHLLEHVTLELMLLEKRLSSPSEPFALTGYTSWESGEDSAGKAVGMKVVISFENDLIALAALQSAADIINCAFENEQDMPRIAQIMRNLHALRRA